MARQIFNQMPEAAKDTSPTPAKRTNLVGSVGGLRDSLREITANSIRDLEPDPHQGRARDDRAAG